jgi:hypothetical protein
MEVAYDVVRRLSFRLPALAAIVGREQSSPAANCPTAILIHKEDGM